MIRTLSILDVPQAMELSQLAGWNQTDRDWQRVLLLEPEGCFCFEMNGRVVATATAIRYERTLGWIGMVLTHPDFRRLGYARQLMEHTVEWLRSAGMGAVKLDATTSGAPLYSTLGFTVECEVERWMRTPIGPVVAPYVPRYASFQLDQKAFGVPRKELMNMLREESWAGSPEMGFAVSRPGAKAAYFGPCIAANEVHARKFLDWFCSQHPEQDLFWDLLPENRAAVALAEQAGFSVARKLVRMSLQLRTDLDVPKTDPFAYYALAGFEYG